MAKWCYFYGIAATIYRFLRVSLMHKNMNRVHWLAYTTAIHSTVTPLLSLYTLWYHVARGIFKFEILHGFWF